MCVAAFCINEVKEFPFIFIANRDEFYSRESRPLHRWADAPCLLGGRDMVGGGTWCALSEDGRLAAVTNYRLPGSYGASGKTSRGLLISDFLTGDLGPEEYFEYLRGKREDCLPYNLVVYQDGRLHHYNSFYDHHHVLTGGFGAVSNDTLNSGWFKAEELRGKLQQVARGTFDKATLFDILKDSRKATRERLPDTGISREREMALSSIFVNLEDYGTLCSIVVLGDAEGNFVFCELSYDRLGNAEQMRVEAVRVAKGSEVVVTPT